MTEPIARTCLAAHVLLDMLTAMDPNDPTGPMSEIAVAAGSDQLDDVGAVKAVVHQSGDDTDVTVDISPLLTATAFLLDSLVTRIATSQASTRATSWRTFETMSTHPLTARRSAKSDADDE